MTGDNGDPWFVGKDMAWVLGYKDSSKAICDHVDDEEKTTLLIQQSGSNYKSNTSIINESGLYSLILSSKLRQAREFKHWVTSEVLPLIRKIVVRGKGCDRGAGSIANTMDALAKHIYDGDKHRKSRC